MRTVKLVRDYQENDEQGTFGTWTTDSGFSVYSLELPNRQNKSNISCIPVGSYKCTMKASPAHGLVYYILNVPGRMDVEIHPANLAGDKEKGWFSQLLGCVSLGRSIGTFKKGETFKVNAPGGLYFVTLDKDQLGVTSSKDAVEGFMADLECKDFTLTITQKEK